MKIIAVNGSPRKNNNTATLLKEALRGAEENGAQTERINLYEQDFKGCISCFACKRKGSTCNGVCAVKDALKPVLERILESDVLLLGSPIYFSNITGEMRAFLERLVFPNLSYNQGARSVFSGKISTVFFYTMNVPEKEMKAYGYEALFEQNKNLLQVLNGESHIFTCTDTYQFKDYSMYEAGKFDAEHKREVREKQFPLDCQRAFELGARLAKKNG